MKKTIQKQKAANLLNEPEIEMWGRDYPQILTGGDYIENARKAIEFIHYQMNTTDQRMRIFNELCAYMRLLKEGKTQ